MTRHTAGVLKWTGTQRNAQTYPLDPHGARYTVDRWADQWVINFLPEGTADKGHELVPWLPGRQSLTTAKAACAAHWSRRTTDSTREPGSGV